MRDCGPVKSIDNILSNLRLITSWPHAYFALRAATKSFNRDQAEDLRLAECKQKLKKLTAAILKRDGLDFIESKTLTDLLSSDFRMNFRQESRSDFRESQFAAREEILKSLEIRALDQSSTDWTSREIAGFECVLRTLRGCVYSPQVKPRLESIRDHSYHKPVAIAAVSEFLMQVEIEIKS